MRSRRVFTKSEIEAIKKYLDEKPNVSLDKDGKRILSKSEMAEIEKLMDDGSKKTKVDFSLYTIFEFLLEVMGWLKIMASPLLIGVVIGLFIYLPNPNNTRLLIATVMVIAGLIVG